jgi:SAM-dependent methyltransferase
MSKKNRAIARAIVYSYLSKNDFLGWFEELYLQALEDVSIIPWADLVPNPNLLTWLDYNQITGAGKKALVIGCGLGDDSEELARRGFETIAFDISSTAIAMCHKRFPNTIVQYQNIDLFSTPNHWKRRFDFVLESYTLQVLPPQLQKNAIREMANFLKLEGILLVISRARERTDPKGKMPWPITREILDGFRLCGLSELTFEDYIDKEDPPIRRFRAIYIKREKNWYA